MTGPFEMLPFLLAQNGNAAAGATPAQPWWSYLPFIAIIGLWFYLLLIRPQQQQDRRLRELREGLKKNDKVVTMSGIYGTVVSVDDGSDRVVLRVDDDRGVKVAFTKASIARVLDGAAEKGKERASETA